MICCLVTVLTGVSVLPYEVSAQEYTVGEVQSLIDGIVDFKLNSAGAGSVQDWINGALTDGAGSMSEWYVMTLSQDGYTDFSSYESALSTYLAEHSESGATGREKYALALTAAGSRNSYISDILDTSVGEQGIMSYIYGLHVLNNGYTCSRFTADDVVSQLLSMQYGDGGWALFGEYGDIDVTAMTMTALSPYYNTDPAVHDAVDRGVDFLSERQQDDGGYQSFGTPNPESAAQVLVAVSAVGIDGVHDGRFIKNDNNLIDGINSYRLPDGSYCHTHDGGFNETATMQALYSFVAYKRMCEGRSSLFVFDNRQPVNVPVQQEEAPPVQHEESAPSGGNSGVNSSNERTEKAVTTSVTTNKKSAVSTSFTSSLTTAAMTTTAKKTTSEPSVTETSALLSSLTSAAHTTMSAPTENITEPKNSGKGKIILIIVGSAAVLSLIILALGKRSYKNFLFIILAAGAASAVVIFTDIRSAEEYYSASSAVKENTVGTVTLEIRCDTIVGKSDSKYIPEDGTILAVTDFDIEAGDTVFDILTEAVQTYGVQMENKGSAGSAHGMVYISGINYIYEMEYGDL